MSTTSKPDHRIPKSTHLHHLRRTITLAQESPPKPTNFRVGCVLVAYYHRHHPSSSIPRQTTEEEEEEEEEEVQGKVISTGYTLELPGNTHAEQCALEKLQQQQQQQQRSSTSTSTSTSSESTETSKANPNPNPEIYLYTSLEPCSIRLSGNTPCVQRIIATRTLTSTSPPILSQPDTDAATNTTTTDTARNTGITHVVFGAKEPGTFVQDSQSCRILTEAGIPWTYLPDYEEEILRVAMEGHVDHASSSSKKPEQQQEEQVASELRDKDVNETTKQGASAKESTSTGTRIDDISEEERKRQEALPRNPKKRMMDTGM